MDKKSLIEKLELIKEPKILVIGDFAIDEMIYGDTERISREAPVLILLHSHTNIIFLQILCPQEFHFYMIAGTGKAWLLT